MNGFILIHTKTSILTNTPKYTIPAINYVLFMQCERQTALTSFLKNISIGNDKLAVIGCGCSIATVAVAEVSWLWNITQVSRLLLDPYPHSHTVQLHIVNYNNVISFLADFIFIFC